MASATLPQLNIADFQPQIIWLLIVFSVFYAVVKLKIIPYFYAETENRDLYIYNNHQESKKLQKKADTLSQDYNEKIKIVHLRANNLILEARKKFNLHLEVEKNRLNDEITVKLNTHYALLQQEFSQVDRELLSDIAVLKQQAHQKIFTLESNSNNNIFQASAVKENGGL